MSAGLAAREGVRMGLGELIAIARECKGWSQRRLEKECGVSNPLISQIELGRVKDPGFATIVRLCDALGIKLERAAECVRMTGILRYEAWKAKQKRPPAGPAME